MLLTDLTEEEGGEGEALDDQNALREILHNVDNSGGLARNEGLMKDLLRRVSNLLLSFTCYSYAIML